MKIKERTFFGCWKKIPNMNVLQQEEKSVMREKISAFTNSHTSYYMLKNCNAVSNRVESFWKLLRSIVGPHRSTVSDLVLLIKMM